ncbi:hypothetical protein [Mechercharimyces sp. CAU 1602]|uniref:hypothetical protein n=1 Tax=Mechercharimyces sp. CAU 1602 TaxID=2973933 RepID=UPI002161E521|nr:hypothetical protein [Mechercharimyces sp. CAU 1602]MCS1351162.1 hypothetical protein [Mechercharimyces sp. CAU 1602]
MESTEAIKKKIARLLADKGVPPFFLADNISLANYDEINLYKRDGMIIVDMYCRDLDTDVPMMFRYKYDMNEVLIRTEMTIGGRESLIWDKREEIEGLWAQCQG